MANDGNPSISTLLILHSFRLGSEINPPTAPLRGVVSTAACIVKMTSGGYTIVGWPTVPDVALPQTKSRGKSRSSQISNRSPKKAVVYFSKMTFLAVTKPVQPNSSFFFNCLTFPVWHFQFPRNWRGKPIWYTLFGAEWLVVSSLEQWFVSLIVIINVKVL